MNESPFFSICVGFMILGVISWIIAFFLGKHESSKASWKNLATTTWHQWEEEFFPDRYTDKSDNLRYIQKGNSYIEGYYRGRYLKLDTFKEPITTANLYTRLVVSGNPGTNGQAKIVNDHINDVLNLIISDLQLRGHITIDKSTHKMVYYQLGIEGDNQYLRRLFDLLNDLLDIYPYLVTAGGKLVSPLLFAIEKNQGLTSLVSELLKGIGEETKKKLSHQISSLLCSDCLVQCSANIVQIAGQTNPITYYGCRACGQSDSFLKIRGQVVAVLDNRVNERQTIQGRDILVNWIVFRKPFDFDRIRVVEATDEDVERFAVQLGNDTDQVRKYRLKQIHCTIEPSCKLTMNTIRILQHAFGQVEEKRVLQV